MHKKRILVIDDDKAVRKSFVLALEDTDYEIDTAESGERGIIMFQKSPYDLIFLDLKMPGMNGVEVLSELRKISNEVPIYIITAFHQEFFDELTNAEKKGLEFEVLKKTIDSNQIVMITNGLLQGPEEY